MSRLSHRWRNLSSREGRGRPGRPDLDHSCPGLGAPWFLLGSMRLGAAHGVCPPTQRAESRLASRKAARPSHFFFLPPDLAIAKVHLSPSDRSREARISKEQCVVFSQPRLPNILALCLPPAALYSPPSGIYFHTPGRAGSRPVGSEQGETRGAGVHGADICWSQHHGAVHGLGRCVVLDRESGLGLRSHGA